jgi:hypothetical protein
MDSAQLSSILTPVAVTAIALAPWGDAQTKAIAIGVLGGAAPGAFGQLSTIATRPRRLTPLPPTTERGPGEFSDR